MLGELKKHKGIIFPRLSLHGHLIRPLPLFLFTADFLTEEKGGPNDRMVKFTSRILSASLKISFSLWVYEWAQ